jgi:hypothetical protein
VRLTPLEFLLRHLASPSRTNVAAYAALYTGPKTLD